MQSEEANVKSASYFFVLVFFEFALRFQANRS